MKYYVSVTETLYRVVSVDAEDEKEAAKKVSAAYRNGEIVLVSDDYDGFSVEPEENQELFRKVEDNGYTSYQHID